MTAMKRHPALQDLSRDHHLFLIHAREIRWAVEGHSHGNPLPAVWEAFLHFWEQDGRPHLQEEEEILFSFYLAYRPAAQSEAERLLADHRWLRERVRELTSRQTPPAKRAVMLAELGRRIYDHVRTEEREFFQGLQAALTEDQLDELAMRSRTFRLQHRSPDAIGPANPSRKAV